jgi:two-component system chemotaxis response regulator CheB
MGSGLSDDDDVSTLRSSARRDANPSHVVAVGASAGGVEALSTLVSQLPRDTTAVVLIVLHLAPHAPSVLPRILARRCALPVRRARTGHRLRPGEVLVAVPDHHLVVHGNATRVVQGPTESGHRPSIDVLFRSVARWWGARSVGVVLTGALDDGSDGLRAISESGGLAIVQDLDEAAVAAMPEHALAAVPDSEVLSLREIGFRLGDLREPAVQSKDIPVGLAAETDLAEEGVGAPWPSIAGDQVPMSCPDCGGPMFEVSDGGLRLRCRVGHGWSAPALARRNSTEIERALWVAARIVEDDIALQQRLIEWSTTQQSPLARDRLARRVDERRRTLRALQDQIRRLADEAAGAELDD